MLPPASSQFGVNSTNSDLNDYGSLGVPFPEKERRSQVEEAVKEAKVSEGPGSIPPRNFFEYQASNKSTEMVKQILNVFSIFWLIVIIVACYFLIKAAVTEASKRVQVKFVSPTTSTTKTCAISKFEFEALNAQVNILLEYTSTIKNLTRSYFEKKLHKLQETSSRLHNHGVDVSVINGNLITMLQKITKDENMNS